MRLKTFAFLCAFLLAAGVIHAQTRELSTSGEVLDKIAAVVNDGVVLVSNLDMQTDQIAARLRDQKTELPPRSVLRKQVLDRLVLQEIQMQRADRAGIRVTDDMVNNALNDVAKQNNINFDDLPKALQAQNIDYRDYRDEVRRDMTLQLLRQRDVLSRINISPRELEQQLAREQNMPDKNSEYNLSHILVSVPVAATPEQLSAREARAREVYEKAKSGENFAQLAVTYSDSGTNIEGGSLGWRPAAQLPSIISDSIPKLHAGEVTEPLRTPSGFHIFRLNEVRGGTVNPVVQQVHARHILLKTNDLEDDETVRQRLNKIRDRVVNGKEDFSAIASVTSQDTGSAPEGGDLGWAGPGTYVPEFEKQLNELKDNEISQPFKSQYGWHIIQLLGRREHDATDDVRRNRAYAALREAKSEEETELWLRRLKDEAFVDIRI
jgi:peptidyl-prolyl cis-trans isomerase SurA